jgi:hypothetical protein
MAPLIEEESAVALLDAGLKREGERFGHAVPVVCAAGSP